MLHSAPSSDHPLPSADWRVENGLIPGLVFVSLSARTTGVGFRLARKHTYAAAGAEGHRASDRLEGQSLHRAP